MKEKLSIIMTKLREFLKRRKWHIAIASALVIALTATLIFTVSAATRDVSNGEYPYDVGRPGDNQGDENNQDNGEGEDNLNNQDDQGDDDDQNGQGDNGNNQGNRPTPVQTTPRPATPSPTRTPVSTTPNPTPTPTRDPLEGFTPSPVVPLSEEMALRIREAFLARRIPLLSPHCDDLVIDDINITRYLNTYSNGVALFISANTDMHHTGLIPEVIGGYDFTITGRNLWIYVFADSTFIRFDIAYENGLISNEELKDLAWHMRQPHDIS